MTKRTVVWHKYLFAATLIATAIAINGPEIRSAEGTLLANGWRVTPWGGITPLGTLPLRVVEDHSGRWLAVTNSGYGAQSLTIVDERSGQIVDSAPLHSTFYGVAFAPDSASVFVSTAADGKVVRFALSAAGKLGPPITVYSIQPGDKAKHWFSGLGLAPDGKTVYVVDGLRNELLALDLKGVARWVAAVGDQPYTVALSNDGSTVYVSNWASSSVSVVDASTGKLSATVRICSHPNAELMRPDGRALYVACANENKVANIDPLDDRLRLTIDVGLFDTALEGATPDGLSLSRDGAKLFVADADDNAVVAVNVTMDLPRDPRSPIMAVRPHVTGAIPAGWYATDVLATRDGNQLFILDGKGISGHANPGFPHADVLTRSQRSLQTENYYVGSLATGDIERMPFPDDAKLFDGLKQARANSPYRVGGGAAITRMPPIKHVIYIIKENRTYDEVLGDDTRGNGEASLAIFGRRITPNTHRLADDFVLLDNFYTDSEVSADGHNWGTAAYATDYVQKLWPASYSDRGRDYDFEQQGPATPAEGYLWDDASRHGKSIRDYGEFVAFNKVPSRAAVAGLEGRVDPDFPGFDTTIADQRRVDLWLREFRAYVANGRLPDLEIVRLPNDHTAATRPGRHTPYAMVADNDYALGRMVDAVNHSRYWKDTVIFVLEDDAQAGPDHVSDQRAEALIIGAWIKRGFVDHTHYTMAGMLHTIELLLRLSPMSQFDAGARPLLADFGATVDLRPWSASRPLVDLRAMNPADATDAQASQRMDLSRADAADPTAFNAILYDFARRASLATSSTFGRTVHPRASSTFGRTLHR